MFVPTKNEIVPRTMELCDLGLNESSAKMPRLKHAK